MPTFTKTYVEPGVYAEYKPAAELVAAPGGPRILALIGSGTPYKVFSETLKRGTTGDTDALSKSVYSGKVNLTVVSDDTRRKYKYNTDFTVSGTSITWQKKTDALVTTGVVSGQINCFVRFRVDVEEGGQIVTKCFSGNITASDATGLASALNNLPQVEGSGTFGAYVNSSAVDTDKVALSPTSSHTYNLTLTLLRNSGTNPIPFPSTFSEGSSVSTPLRPICGSTYHVSYYVAKEASDYEPIAVYSLKQAEELFGSYSTVGDIEAGNLTLAAEIAFSQRVPVLVCVQVQGSNYTDYTDTIDKLRSVDVSVIVPLVTDDNIRESVFNYVIDHVEKMSTIESRKWRTAVLAFSNTASIDYYLSKASEYGAPSLPTRNRVVLVYANSLRKDVLLEGKTSPTTVYLDNIYAAVGVAALSCSSDFDVATSLTRKRVAGIQVSSVATDDRRRLSDGGVLVLDNYLGVPTVVHAVTVSRSGLASEREYVITNVVDYVQSSCILVLENLFIGRKVSEMESIQLLLSVFLDYLRRSEVIADFTNVSVSQNSVEPTQLDVSFKIKPLWPINWIYIQFSLTR